MSFLKSDLAPSETIASPESQSLDIFAPKDRVAASEGSGTDDNALFSTVELLWA